VRQTERFVQSLLKDPRPEKVAEPQPDPNVRAAIDELQRVLGTRVRIIERSKRRGGRIEIDYYTPEDLDRIYASIVGQP
jgi:ParB family chromosome partitioning protein